MKIFKTEEEIFDIFCQSQAMADFLNLHAKQLPSTLKEIYNNRFKSN